MTDTVESPAIETPPDPAEPTSLALAPRDRSGEILKPVDAEELVAAFEAYQALVPRLLNATDYQQTRDGRFKKKSAWRKLARAFRLNCSIVNVHVERDDDGNPIR